MAIERACEVAPIDRLDALIVAHNHYDHAFDAAVLAQRSRPRLVASSSAASIDRGYGLAENPILD